MYFGAADIISSAPELAQIGQAKMRTTRKTVTFSKPFSLLGLDGAQPAGDYIVVTDEKRIDTTLFEAWQRIATQIRLPSLASDTGMEQYTTINARDLDDALRLDHTDTASPRPERMHD